MKSTEEALSFVAGCTVVHLHKPDGMPNLYLLDSQDQIGVKLKSWKRN